MWQPRSSSPPRRSAAPSPIRSGRSRRPSPRVTSRQSRTRRLPPWKLRAPLEGIDRRKRIEQPGGDAGRGSRRTPRSPRCGAVLRDDQCTPFRSRPSLELRCRPTGRRVNTRPETGVVRQRGASSAGSERSERASGVPRSRRCRVRVRSGSDLRRGTRCGSPPGSTGLESKAPTRTGSLAVADFASFTRAAWIARGR